MALPNQTPYTTYTANGITTVFPFTFMVFSASDLAISFNGTVLTSGFTVSGAGAVNGGAVTFLTPPANGVKVMIARDMPLVRNTEYQNNGDLLASTVNQDFDRIWMVLQGQALNGLLALRRPWFNYNYFEGQGYRIANIADPTAPQDATTKKYVDDSVSANLGSAVRVPDGYIPPLPDISHRRNKLSAFNDAGQPIAVLPQSGSASDVMIELAKPTGASLVGVQPQGNLSQAINWVTPEQFGAIGDGTVHPLSERYATLAAAQAVYPHVTSLGQTIDWAACQAAENYTRGIACVWVKRVVNYHLGDEQLTLSEQSWWIGYADPQNDKPGARFTKNLPLTSQGIDACSIVCVAVSSGPDIFQRGIVFDGFQLRYPVARRAATKGKGTVGLHIGTAIKSKFNVSVWGAEYAVYDPAGWSNTGRLAWDTCHKGYFQPPKIAAGVYAGLGGHTSNDFRIESDMCPFPITLFGDAYSQYLGYYEGISLTDPIYDAANETACGITSISAHTVTLRMGRELWNGVDTCLYLDNEVTLEIMPFSDAQYPASTGESTSLDSFYTNWGGSNTIANFKCLKLGRAIHNMYSDKASTLVIKNAGYYMGNVRTDVTVTRYFFNGGGSLSSNIVLIGGYLNITQESGAAPTAFSLNVIDYSKADIQGCRGAEVYISPGTVYKWQSKNRWVARNNVSVPMTISGTNGQYADFSAPAGYDIVDIHRLTTDLGIEGNYIQYRPAIYSYDIATAALRVGTTFYTSQLTAYGMPIIRVRNSYVG
ncbi:Tail fiber [Yersinia kristensenii]|nr:Tail fiber [Yersinia kristensenii]